MPVLNFFYDKILQAKKAQKEYKAQYILLLRCFYRHF